MNSFLFKKTDIEHAVNFHYDLACSYCDKINFTLSVSEFAKFISVIDLIDNFSVWKSENSQFWFLMLSIVSKKACQQSIAYTQHIIQDHSHAETVTFSTCSKTEIKNSDNLIAKKHWMQIHIYTDEL